MTLKAAECIGKADVIVYDRLVNNNILKLANERAQLIYVGKKPDHHAVTQEGINEILVKKALEGKIVTRVKGGDPFLFGRGGEEAQALAEHGIEFEIVSGVTSAIAVPAYAGIPVTHRDYCSSLHIITGHEKPGKEESSIDYANLARLEGTLVFLMGVKNLPEISQNLIKHGKKGNTPAAVIENGTTPIQRTVTGTLSDIARIAAEAKIQSPAVTVVGGVAELEKELKWFPKGELAGKRILVTRSRNQASKLVERIEDLGGEAVEFPTIKIMGPEDFQIFDQVLGNLESFKWIVFTSVNGVAAFFGRMKEKGIDIRNLYGVKLCAIGDATGQELANYGLTVDFMPGNYTTSDLLKGLLERVKPGEKVLLARADIGSEELSEGLIEKGIDLTDLAAYRTVVPPSSREDLIRAFDERVDYITFTSSSTVKNFVSILGKENLSLISGTRIACIGPVTAKTSKELGLNADIEADVYTVQGLVDSILKDIGKNT